MPPARWAIASGRNWTGFLRPREKAMERDLEQTSLADVINAVKASGACAEKSRLTSHFFERVCNISCYILWKGLKNMKSNDTGLNGKAGEGGKTFKNNCLASCQKVLARIANAKEAIFNESLKCSRPMNVCSGWP